MRASFCNEKPRINVLRCCRCLTIRYDRSVSLSIINYPEILSDVDVTSLSESFAVVACVRWEELHEWLLYHSSFQLEWWHENDVVCRFVLLHIDDMSRILSIEVVFAVVQTSTVLSATTGWLVQRPSYLRYCSLVVHVTNGFVSHCSS